MNTRMKTVLFNLFGIDQREPIIDDYMYYFNGNSYAGGSLSDTNILFITNINKTAIIEDEIKKEGAVLSKVMVDKENLSFNEIKAVSESLIGPYVHIVNVFQVNYSFENDENTDILRMIYQSLQVEVDYLVELGPGQNSTICVVLIVQKKVCNIIIDSVKSLVTGLSEPLSRHGILVSGFVAANTVSQDKIGKWICFLNSKYGHILTGDFLQLTLDF